MLHIETQDLTKRYGAVPAVDRVSIAVGPGQVFGFLGPNGAGKTTTIGMLLGIITPSGGAIRLFGLSGQRGLHAARQRIGATLETPNFYPYLSGWDNLRIVARIKGASTRRVEEVLEIVALADRRRDKFQTYSLGMKQRLALAATLIGDPELLILDEPANGLDPQGMSEVRDVILALAERGKTVFLSSHLLFEVERTCTHVAILKKGRVLRHGSITDILGGAAVLLRAKDTEALRAAVASYPAAAAAMVTPEGVVARLTDDDTGSLNRFLAGKGVFVSYLAPHRASLEDAFLDLTRDGDNDAMTVNREVA